MNKCNHVYGQPNTCLVMHYGECHCYDNAPLRCLKCGALEEHINLEENKINK